MATLFIGVATTYYQQNTPEQNIVASPNSINTIGQIGNNSVVNNILPQRTILSVKNELTSKLRLYPRQDFKIKLSYGGVEADHLATEISTTLKEVRWNEISYEYRFDGYYPTGVTIEVQEVNKESQLLADLFAQAGLKVIGNKTLKSEILTIYVGPSK